MSWLGTDATVIVEAIVEEVIVVVEDAMTDLVAETGAVMTVEETEEAVLVAILQAARPNTV